MDIESNALATTLDNKPEGLHDVFKRVYFIEEINKL